MGARRTHITQEHTGSAVPRIHGLDEIVQPAALNPCPSLAVRLRPKTYPGLRLVAALAGDASTKAMPTDVDAEIKARQAILLIKRDFIDSLSQELLPIPQIVWHQPERIGPKSIMRPQLLKRGASAALLIGEADQRHIRDADPCYASRWRRRAGFVPVFGGPRLDQDRAFGTPSSAARSAN